MKCTHCDQSAEVVLQTEDRAEHAVCTAGIAGQVVDLINEYGEGAPVFLYLAEGQ